MATITTTTTTMAAAETCGTIPEDGDGQPRRAQTGTGTATRATATATATAPEPAPETMMIALYYCYTTLPPSDDGSDGGAVRRHASFQTDLCESLKLSGRIRVSPEGINGVLSGRRCDLEAYEDALRRELSPPAGCARHEEENDEKEDGVGHGGGGGDSDAADGIGSSDATTSDGGGARRGSWSSSDQSLDLDVKYCHLRPDLDAESQLFDSLSVKETAEVVSLHEPGPRRPTAGKGKKKNWRRRRRRRNRDRGEQRRQQPLEEEEGGDGERPDRHGPRDDEGCCRRSGESDDPDEPPRRRREDEGGDNEKGTKREFAPATHLTPEEWHASLLRASAAAASASASSDGANSGNNGVGGGAVLLDARNVYESRVGHFAVPGVPTVLTNTRKYSNLPGALGASAREFEGRDVYMYCTGGVRCERASVYLREMMEGLAGEEEGMEGPRAVYQLRGGIQRYLEVYGRLQGGMPPEKDVAGEGVDGAQEDVCEEEPPTMPSRPCPGPFPTSADEECVGNDGAAVETLTAVDGPPPPMEEIGRKGRNGDVDGDDGSSSSSTCLYRGKNFVFDPRRTDPVVGAEPSPSIVGRCLVCQAPHDDYDNGHAPAENREARCCRCRVLVLVCDDCRRGVRCWGEEEGDVDAGTATEGFDDVERADANSSARRGGNGGGGDAAVVDINGGRTKARRRRPDLFCGPGGAECIDEGNAVNVEVICEENA